MGEAKGHTRLQSLIKWLKLLFRNDADHLCQADTFDRWIAMVCTRFPHPDKSNHLDTLVGGRRHQNTQTAIDLFCTVSRRMFHSHCNTFPHYNPSRRFATPDLCGCLWMYKALRAVHSHPEQEVQARISGRTVETLVRVCSPNVNWRLWLGCIRWSEMKPARNG